MDFFLFSKNIYGLCKKFFLVGKKIVLGTSLWICNFTLHTYYIYVLVTYTITCYSYISRQFACLYSF